MKKLRMDLQGLEVESFETFVPEERRGTVRANGGCVTWSCPPGTCGAYLSEIEKNGNYAPTFACGSNNCCA
jgi:hypothetical protein